MPKTDAPVVNIEKTDAPKTDEPAKPAEPVYESENLTKLRAEQSTLEDKLDAAGIKTPDGKKLMQELWKIGESIENEIASIKKLHAQAELDEKRNARVKLFDDVLPLYDAMKAANAAVDAIPADQRVIEPLPADVKTVIDAANDAKHQFDTARELVTNILLSGLPSGKSTTASTGTASTGTKGKTTSEIRELIAPMYVAGKTGAEVRKFIITDKGYNDGTANAVILKYEQEHHLNGK